MMTRGRRLYFTKGYAELVAYIGRNGETRMDIHYMTASGFRLGEWVTDIRSKWASGELMPDEERKLIRAGIAPVADDQTWEDMYRLASDYYHRNGVMDIAQNYRAEDGALLGAWVFRQQRMVEMCGGCEGPAEGTALTKKQTERLAQIGICRKMPAKAHSKYNQ